MRIKFQQFLFGQLHSWALTSKMLAREFIAQQHEVDLISTDGLTQIDPDLKPYQRNHPTGTYDCQISYTLPINWGRYLGRGQQNRFAIWCYEWPIIPQSLIKYHLSVDKILAPSHFARQGFLAGGVPEDKVIVVPHGITLQDFSNQIKFPLKTSKKYKILVDIASPHLRKNIINLFRAYFKAFKTQDDVCLVAKIKKPDRHGGNIEVDPVKLLAQVRAEFKNHPAVELITDYIPNMIELYNACDIVYTMSHCEGFYLPGLNALAANKVNIAPRYGGQLDFLNDNNSLLVEGKVIRADAKMQYIEPNVRNSCFDPSLDDAVVKLKYAVENCEMLKTKFKTDLSQYAWSVQANKILSLCKEVNGN